MLRSALPAWMMAFALALGCGGRESGTSSGTSGSTQAGAGANAGASAGDSSGSNVTASTGYGTPQDCAAAGGQCVIGGGGGLCVQEGPANTCNCNPGCNPGGAICCVAFGGGDMGASPPDAEADDASAGGDEAPSSPADASCDASAHTPGTACPSFATSCPCGCYAAVNPQRYDRTNGCLEPGFLNVCSTDPGSEAVFSCWVRVETGDAYLFAATPLIALISSGSGWQPCTQTDGIPSDGGNEPPPCALTSAAFVGTWLCSDDAGHSVSFTAAANGNELTETFSSPVGSAGGALTCTEQFNVSGSTATLIPSLTSCTVPQGVHLDAVPAYESETVSGNTLTLNGEDEGGPLQTVTCTRQ